MSYIEHGCPDCQVPIAWNARGQVSKVRWEACGLSQSEHREVAKARALAEKQAHELMVQDRIEQQLPKAIIKEIYDQAQRDVRRSR